MRSKTAHAVRSGVGESAARESESAKRRHIGKESVATSNPKFGPRNLGSAGLFVFNTQEGQLAPSRTFGLAFPLCGAHGLWFFRSHHAF